ncbi:hypothetical protein [Janibacter alittae]|uniref:Uncharacterized protein n=1 Tax=Janibacter alittae TaxID=3115209 RepID=A0ABZ2MH37_9MICO
MPVDPDPGWRADPRSTVALGRTLGYSLAMTPTPAPGAVLDERDTNFAIVTADHE